MKTLKLVLGGLVVGIVFAGMLAALVWSYGETYDPAPGNTFFIEECNLVCIEWSDGSGDCYECNSDTCRPVDPVPTPTNRPNPEPTPEPEPKPKCNSGRGNESEGDPDCDPGNSGGHNQGGD